MYFAMMPSRPIPGNLRVRAWVVRLAERCGGRLCESLWQCNDWLLGRVRWNRADGDQLGRTGRCRGEDRISGGNRDGGSPNPSKFSGKLKDNSSNKLDSNYSLHRYWTEHVSCEFHHFVAGWFFLNTASMMFLIWKILVATRKKNGGMKSTQL